MEKRANIIDFIEFPAKDVAGIADAKNFYEKVFNWSFRNWGDDYIDTLDSGVGSGFNADSTHKPAAPLAVIYSEDLERARTCVMAAGGIISREIFSFPGGRRFHFADPAGNELAVWSDK